MMTGANRAVMREGWWDRMLVLHHGIQIHQFSTLKKYYQPFNTNILRQYNQASELNFDKHACIFTIYMLRYFFVALYLF